MVQTRRDLAKRDFLRRSRLALENGALKLATGDDFGSLRSESVLGMAESELTEGVEAEGVDVAFLREEDGVLVACCKLNDGVFGEGELDLLRGVGVSLCASSELSVETSSPSEKFLFFELSGIDVSLSLAESQAVHGASNDQFYSSDVSLSVFEIINLNGCKDS